MNKADLIAKLAPKLNINQDEAEKQKTLADLNEYLTEDRDRKLFDLLNIEEN